MNQASSTAKEASRKADNSTWVDRAARVGLIALSIVHLMFGWLAIQLALGDREGEASTSGAVKELADQPFGGVIIWLVAVGLVLLTLWQALEAIVGHTDKDGKDRAKKRISSAGKAVIYGVLAFTAIKVAIGSGGGGGGTDSMTAKLMDMPAGQFLVGAVGVGIIIGGCYLIYRGVADKFLDDIEGSGQTGKTGTAYVWFGRVGYCAKGAALGVVGGLFLYAAISHKPKESGGMDEALTTVLKEPFGPALLIAMGVGIICFGLFCFAWSRHLDR